MIHYILTRFTLDIQKWNYIYQDKTAIHRRIKVFEQYTLPSVISQSCQNFRWVIFCGNIEMSLMKEHIEKWKSMCPQIEIYWHFPFIRDQKIFFNDWTVKNTQNDEHIIQTRLDSDDILSLDFVQNIQNHCQISKVIIVPCGYFFDVTSQRMYFYRSQGSPFTSVVSIKNDIVKSIYSVGGGRVNRLGDVIFLEFVPWIRILHGDNVEGRTRVTDRKLVTKEDKFLDHFPNFKAGL